MVIGRESDSTARGGLGNWRLPLKGSRTFPLSSDSDLKSWRLQYQATISSCWARNGSASRYVQRGLLVRIKYFKTFWTPTTICCETWRAFREPQPPFKGKILRLMFHFIVMSLHLRIDTTLVITAFLRMICSR